MTHDDYLALTALLMKFYTCIRYLLCVQCMALGVLFLVAFQMGRKGGK